MLHDERSTPILAYAERAELDETIRVLTRCLADEHGIPASYPPSLV
jgi:hypothetical protein